ncbi:MAG: hypothetical protein PHD02_04325 [Bacilli bacterium]|nr:hypothetical protein [Bacilli bacterium]
MDKVSNGIEKEFAPGVADEEIIESLKENGLRIYYVEKPTEEMQRIAVRQNPLAIIGIKHPCEEVFKIAFKALGYLVFMFPELEENLKNIAIESILESKIDEEFSEEGLRLTVDEVDCRIRKSRLRINGDLIGRVLFNQPINEDLDKLENLKKAFYRTLGITEEDYQKEMHLRNNA